MNGDIISEICSVAG